MCYSSLARPLNEPIYQAQEFINKDHKCVELKVFTKNSIYLQPYIYTNQFEPVVKVIIINVVKAPTHIREIPSLSHTWSEVGWGFSLLL